MSQGLSVDERKPKSIFKRKKMSRVRTTKRKETEKPKEWPAVVFLWIIGLALLGYVLGRIALDTYPHPYHWLSGLVGGILGIGLGWVWYWRKGDIF